MDTGREEAAAKEDRLLRHHKGDSVGNNIHTGKDIWPILLMPHLLTLPCAAFHVINLAPCPILLHQ